MINALLESCGAQENAGHSLCAPSMYNKMTGCIKQYSLVHLSHVTIFIDQ